MFNKLKALFLLPFFVGHLTARVNNISPLGNVGQAVNILSGGGEARLSDSGFFLNATLFGFDSANSRFIFANGTNRLNTSNGGGSFRIGYFENSSKGINAQFGLLGTGSGPSDFNTDANRIRTMATSGSVAYIARGTATTNRMEPTTEMYKVDLNNPADLPAAKTMFDKGGAQNAGIDKMLFVPGKGDRPDCVVVAGFANGGNSYRGSSSGIVRVLKAADLTPLGDLRLSDAPTVTVKFTSTDGAGDLRDELKASQSSGSDVDFVSTMHYDADLDVVIIGINGTNPSSSIQYCPYLVCTFDANNNLLGQAIFKGNLATTDVQTNNIVETHDDLGKHVGFVKTMKVGSNVYMISNLQLINDSIISNQNGAANKCIHATPLVSLSGSADIGRAAFVNLATGDVNFSTASSSLSNLYRAAPVGSTRADKEDTTCSIPALVGGGPVPCDIQWSTPVFLDGAGNKVFTANITSVEVVANTVFVGVTDHNFANGALGDSAQGYNHKIGVWASTAVVNENGVICGWTPWTRVFGMHLPVYGMHFDMARLAMWVAHREPNGNYIAGCSVTTPYTGHSVAAGQLNAFGATGATTLFRQLKNDVGKIHTMRMFHGHRTANLGAKSVLVVAGENGIAFAKTADTDWSANGIQSSCPLRESGALAVFPSATPTYAFLPYSGTASAVKGTVNTIEFSRLRDAAGPVGRGWFFVGTDKGLYVLATSTGGGSSTGSIYVPYGNGYSFVEVTLGGASLANVQDLAVIGTGIANQLLVLCNDKLVSIGLSTANVGGYTSSFPTANTVNINLGGVNNIFCNFEPKEVAYSLKLLPSLSSAISALNDYNGVGIILTSKGLYQVRGLYNATSVTLEPLFADVLGEKAGVKVRSIEVLPLNPWAEHAQQITTASTVANLYITTGSATGNVGSAVYVAALKGFMKYPVNTGLTDIRTYINGDDAYVFGLSPAADQNSLFLASVSAGKNPVFGANELGGNVLNKVQFSGLPLISMSWNSDLAKAGILPVSGAGLISVAGDVFKMHGLSGMGGQQLFEVDGVLAAINE